MSTLAIVVTLARVACTLMGFVVFLMWLLGSLGLADFRLIFIVPEALP